MPICNIIDRTTNNCNCDISVIYDDSWHDNGVYGARQFEVYEPNTPPNIDYLGITKTTIELAIKYANQRWDHPITLLK